jgi:5-formyltetrahydrofolate cyclo-ligase
LADNLQRFLISQAGLWAGYMATEDEANPSHAIAKMSHIEWAYPKVEGQQMAFFVAQSQNNFIQNQWNIWEPQAEKSKKVEPSLFSGLLIPGIAFDRTGHRLGWGRGYYDRYLEASTAVKVGVAYSIQIDDSLLPHDGHDVRLNWIITEKEIIPVGDAMDSADALTTLERK